MLVGNKTDLSDKRQVSTDEGERKVNLNKTDLSDKRLVSTDVGERKVNLNKTDLSDRSAFNFLSFSGLHI